MGLQNQDITIELVTADKVVDEINVITAAGGSFEVTNKTRNNIEYTAFSNLPINLGAMYQAAATAHGDKEFLVFNEERHSYSSLLKRANAFAYVLQSEYSVQKGDKVAIAMRNYPEWIVAFMGITMLGAVAVPLNAWLQESEFVQVIEHSQSVLLITDDKRFSLLDSWLQQQNFPCIIARPSQSQPKNYDFNSMLVPFLECELIDSSVASDDVATIFYTSGSTGVPKGAVSTHESILTAINTWLMLGTAAAVANGPATTSSASSAPAFEAAALMTVPLFHVTGCHTLFLLSMISGRKTVMMPYWDAELALKLIEQERITYFNGVPTMSMELMEHPDKDNYDLSSLSDVCAGGAARPPEHVRKIYNAFDNGNPSCGYGLTETNALGAVNGPADYVKKPSSAGLPTPPVVDVKIVSEDDQYLSVGEVGEIAIKSISNIVEYWQEPEITKAAFIDGYFRTGDLGYLDEDGFIFIVDRAKDIIIRGGENISCLEVESALYKHPQIIEASAFSIFDQRLGEVVGAAVTVSESSSLDTEQLKEFVAQHLAQFKVPEAIWFHQQKLPKLGSGKINKRALKALYDR
ncbi:class I adenylate-forming enzyme family protein [Thalassotalea crassostreae]|uniref:class I adenylate-forming enzyme family protein n=1 Tax=Thalassotalea crassostreae TaxID=1763536 RepID=UPI000837D1AF|nr:class I adenylate-forming enzyme family protein [Thalassotalea crassostreae]